MSAKFVRRSSRTGSSSTRAMMHALEDRKMFAAVPTATKVVDHNGPVADMVEAGGTIYLSAPLASGGSVLRIYATDGVADHTKLLLDLSQPGMPFASIDDLAATEDGRVFFTASATGGRHLFELNVSNGKVIQLSTGTNKYYTGVVAAGTRLYLRENNSDTLCTVNPGEYAANDVTQIDTASELRASGSSIFFMGPNGTLWRSDGTAGGTVKVSGDYTTGSGDFFSTNEFVVFEGRKDGENTSLFIVSLDGTSPQKVADDFSLLNLSHAEVNGWVYFSGGYYNTSPNANGTQLYRVNAAGTVELASKISGGNGAGAPDGIGAIGTSVYFTAGDSEFLPSQGTNDRELFKFDTISKETTLVTKGNALYPVEIGAGALSSYYFVAAPDKENARFGSRALYRTNPVTDEVELVQGLPVVDKNGTPTTTVRAVAVGANGFFFTADTQVNGKETDVFFTQTPFSSYDPQSMIVTITGTDFADYTTMRVENGELILTQNGFEERHQLSLVGRIEAFLKKGNDIFVSDASVVIPTYAIGDEGDDRMVGGAGNDTLTGGAGRNVIWGGEGNDRLNGAGGRDVIVGEGGDDSIMGQGGNDVLLGGHGSDWIQAGLGDDQVFGSLGADRLYGEDGNDTIYGQLSADLIVGGAGDDVLDGAQGIDAIDGGAGVDTIIGGDDDDQLFANDGGELDFIYGGNGNDTATADAAEGLFDLVETIL